MTSSKYSIQVPGKLFLSGEYAILEPNSKALILALDRYLYVDIEPSDHFSIRSSQWPDLQFDFEYQDHTIIWKDEYQEDLRFIEQALLFSLEYLKQQSMTIVPFQLRIRSELATKAVKLGLGSSAALSVGIVASIFSYAGLDVSTFKSKLKIFKLAYISHWLVQQGGSGADIAVCTFGGVVYYQKADPLIPQTLSHLSHCLELPWPYLEIETLSWPSNIPLCIGWTGIAASTVDFIQSFSSWKYKCPQEHQVFIEQSVEIVMRLKEALKNGELDSMIHLLRLNRELLHSLSNQLELTLEVPSLTTLCHIAESLQGAAKFSGAGGGDCGISIVPDLSLVENLKHRWEQANIQLLNLKIDVSGVQKTP